MTTAPIMVVLCPCVRERFCDYHSVDLGELASVPGMVIVYVAPCCNL